MMGRKRRDQGKPFYEFRLEERIRANHLLRRMNLFVSAALANLHKTLEPYYSDIGRPSVDPELMIRMLIVGHTLISYNMSSLRTLAHVHASTGARPNQGRSENQRCETICTLSKGAAPQEARQCC